MMAACGITGLFKLRMIEHCGRWVLTNVEAELINSSTLQLNDDDIEVLSCNDRYVYSVLHSDALLIISKVHSQHPLIWWRSNCKQSSHTHLLLWWRPLLEAVLLFFSSVFWSIVPPNKEGDSIFSWSISRNITRIHYNSTVQYVHCIFAVSSNLLRRVLLEVDSFLSSSTGQYIVWLSMHSASNGQ